MNKLEELQKEIRSKIPRLMELRRGCRFSDDDEFTYMIDEVCTINNNQPFVLYHEEDSLIDIYDFIDGYELDFIKKNYEIIGHPIKLSDVLKWLSIDYNNMYIVVGVYLDFIDHEMPVTAKGKQLYWKDDYLHEQDEELINYLHSLIK